MGESTENSVDAVWFHDSESSCDYLLDRKSGKIVAQKDKYGTFLFVVYPS